MKPRAHWAYDEDRIRAAITHLQEARNLLRRMPKACDKVRRALKSAEGAARHARNLRIREGAER